ncbi:MAG TPA: hemerythrin domain-containing protein [Usitatibacter sp.]|nr:hemerythrin domain-containing protein [Usitatibacter sp.]
MARSNRSAASLPVALELLASDHRKVEALFDRFDEEKEDGEESRRDLAERICKELTAHTRIEEEIFYPWLRENLDAESRDLIDEALVEHATAKDLIAQIEGAGDVDETYDARVKVLGEYVRHHVREEENEIFPQVAGEQDELDELGQEMHACRAELMEELGLPAQGEDEGAGMGKATRARRPEARQPAQRSSH